MSDHPEATAGPRIAVVGMSGRFPGARNPAELWRNLRVGVESITRFSDDELAAAGVDRGRLADPAYVKAAGVLAGVESFDAALFGFSPREAELLDPQHRLLLECAWEALEDAGYAPGATRDKVGVFAGTSYPAYLLEHVHPTLAGADFATAYAAALANDKDFLATRISYKLDLKGPSLTVGTGCSTSLVAVCQACASLAIGDCDVALAGGVTVRLPHRAGYLYQDDGILSPDGHCRAFDAAARGTVPGSGAGMVVLKRLDDALAAGDTVRAVVRGWAVNNDGGEKAGYTAPRAEGQAEVVLEALALARVSPETVTYVEAHGTGTPLGDPIEIRALRQAFAAAGDGRRGGCALGSVKTNLGHLDAAAGIAGLVKTLLCLEHRQLVPSLHCERPNPELELESSPFRVATALAEWPSNGAPRRAGVSSFGIGGTNAHVVLEEAPRPSPRPASAPGRHLLVLSAATETALGQQAANLAGRLREAPDLHLADVASTLGLGRKPLAWRRAVVCGDREEAVAALAEGGRTAHVEPGHRPVAFLFPGQGSQRPAMAAELHRRGGVALSELERCLRILDRHLAPERMKELRTLLLEAPPGGDERLAHTALAQPALFAVEYALARLWMSWGIEPEAMLGHSVGELVAACLAEVFTLDDALAVVAARGTLVGDLAPGAMLAVPLAEEELRPRLGGLSLAAVNGPSLCAVSGDAAEIAAFADLLRSEGLESRRLTTSHAFHSPQIEPVLGAFRDAVSRVERRPPRRRFLSNVTGTWISAEEATDPDYWADHLRHTVRFAPAVAELLAEPRRVFLEVGPGAGLAALVRKHPEARERTVVASLARPGETAAVAGALEEAAAELWLAGVAVDGQTFHGGGRRVPLPTYPFEGRRCWIEARATAVAPAAADAMVKKPDPADWFSIPAWKRTLPVAALSRAPAVDGPWLLLGDGGGLAPRLAEELRRRGESVVSGLEESGEVPRRVVSLLGVGATAGPYAAGPYADLHGLLDLVRALAPRLGGGKATLAVVTDGLWEVTGGEARGPARGAAAGLLKVVPQEVPGLVCRAIDVAPGEDRVGELAAELVSAAREPVVALRGGHRWQLVYEPVRLADPGDAGRPRPGSHFLVTGGLGRFGLMLAEHLGGSRGARLTLLDRRPPSAAEAKRLAALGEVAAIEVDVADRAALLKAVRAAVERWGEPAGVIHAAGAPADSYKSLFEVGTAELEEHLRPKVAGALALDAALAEILGPGPPIVCHATTSLASVLGGVGLTPYVVADAALDAFVQSRGAAGRTRWVSVNWEGWQQIAARGLAALEQQNALAMTPAEVADVFERVHALPGQPRLVVATGDLDARRAQSAAGRKSAAAPAVPSASAPYRAPSDPVEARIAEVWQEVLGVERVGADDDFFLLGGDSLNGLQVLSKLRAEFAVELPLESFFEARTVAGMAAAIAAEKRPAELDDERVAELLAEIEELSDEEVRTQLTLADDSMPIVHDAAPADLDPPRKPLEFSLFFFSADGSTGDGDKYRMLFECARFGDREGFTAVWVPERHFQDFGGLYPNPSVLAAALAVATERLQIRAGSVVLPLHHPVRVAEEWAVVDNLSQGRAAISCASGWHPADFVLNPAAFEERKEVMYRDIETLRRLWAGETLRLPGGGGEEYEVRILPRPIRKELPIWVTSAGSARTWERAGEVGAHVLASLAAQPLEDLRRKITLYREARQRAGHDPETGIVSLMLHTFIGDDFEEVKAKAREPLSDYLRTYMQQRENFMDLPGITGRDKEALIPLAYEHYLRSASLVGTVESCAPLLDRLAAVGVDEIACLSDFGLPMSDVTASLERLSELRRRHREAARPAGAAR